jgi:hypothetical protein
MEYTIENMCNDLNCFINAEEKFGYSDKPLLKLYKSAAIIKKKILGMPCSNLIPFEIWHLFSNIDMGAIKKEYREWILEDARAAIKKIIKNNYTLQ